MSILSKFNKPATFTVSDALAAAGILTAAKAFQYVAEGAVSFLAAQAKQLARALLTPMLTASGAGAGAGGKGAGKGGGKGGASGGAGKGGDSAEGKAVSMGARVFSAPYVERMKNTMLNSFLGVTEEKAKS